VIAIAPDTHHHLYHEWQKAIAFCRDIPDVDPPAPVTFHMFWREKRRGLWRKTRRFGRKQALPVKSFFATQDLSRCSLILWSDEDLSDSEWLAPFASRMAFRAYRPEAEVVGTPLEKWPALYGQQDKRVWRDGDLFRILALHNYGGVYVDMDMVLLRNLGALLGQEFIYQWQHYSDRYNGALMHLWKGSDFARELINGIVEIPPGEFNWGRENLKRAIDRGRAITVFPSAFFNTEWTADEHFQPFTRTSASTNLYEGAFAWHWHNRWDDTIEDGSKFQILEARVHQQLLAKGLPAGPSVAGHRT
jgi:hypothetical protein